MQDLRLTIIQDSLAWLDPAANRERFSRYITELKQPTDLILLPEMFTTGFTMQPQEVAEPTQGPTLQWMQQMAAAATAAVTGSLVIKQGENYLNRLLFVYPDGSYQHYDKRHLFRMANEQAHYQAGNKKQIVEFLGWKICPQICYDLRFPVWSRNQESYDLLFYVANWPASRSAHWLALLKARAIENLCFVAGVNRIGRDGNNYDYQGDSLLLDAQGNFLIPPQERAGSYTQTLKYGELQAYRERFPAFLDADQFQIKDS